MVAQPFLNQEARSMPEHLLPLRVLDLESHQLLVLLLPPIQQRRTPTLSPLSLGCTALEQRPSPTPSRTSPVPVPAAPTLRSKAAPGGTFVTAPSDRSAPSATASATSGTDDGSGSGSGSGGAENSETAGKCHDPAAPTDTGAAGGGDGAGVTVTLNTSLTLQVTVTSNLPPAASDATSAPASAPASEPASAPAAAPSGLGGSTNDAAGSGDSGGSGSGDGDGASHEKKQCKPDEVAVCFDDDYSGICDNEWVVP